MTLKGPPSEFYYERAANSARQAAATYLPMVKAKHLEDERVWHALADRTAALEASRATNARDTDL